MKNTILSLMITTCLSFSINGYAEEDREEDSNGFSIIASDDDDEDGAEFSIIASDDEDTDEEENLLAKCVNGKCPKEKIESLRKERQEQDNEEEEANQLA